MPQITVNIVGGSQKENTLFVTIGSKRWGKNGVKFGTAQEVPEGEQDFSLHKTTEPEIFDTKIDIPDEDATVEITVNDKTIDIEIVS